MARVPFLFSLDFLVSAPLRSCKKYFLLDRAKCTSLRHMINMTSQSDNVLMSPIIIQVHAESSRVQLLSDGHLCISLYSCLVMPWCLKFDQLGTQKFDQDFDICILCRPKDFGAHLRKIVADRPKASVSVSSDFRFLCFTDFFANWRSSHHRFFCRLNPRVTSWSFECCIRHDDIIRIYI